MNEHEKYLVEQLVKSVTWRLGCEKLFGKEMDSLDLDEIREIIYATGKKVLFDDRTFRIMPEATTFEEYCALTVRRYGIAEDLFTEKMIAKIFEKELREAYDKTCTETDS